MRAGSYMERLQNVTCEDVPYNDTAYNAFLDNWEAVGWTWPSGFCGARRQLKLRWGCWVLPWLELGAANLCVEGGAYWPIRPLSYFCPATCGCRAGDPHCPLTCPAFDPECRLRGRRRPATAGLSRRGLDSRTAFLSNLP